MSAPHLFPNSRRLAAHSPNCPRHTSTVSPSLSNRSGTIQLNSLELDVDAVNNELDRQAAEAPNLAVPFKVLSGRFESFQVDVPWSQIMSRPVVLRADGLKVVVEPHNRAESESFLYAVKESDPARAKKIDENRTKSLDSADEYRRQANALRKLAQQDLDNENLKSGSKASSSSSFGARLVRRIIENIQVEISNVHVSLHGSSGSAGTLLQSLTLVTTDADGKRTFVDRTATTAAAVADSFLYKALSIRGLAVYLDEDDPTKGGGGGVRPEDMLASIAEEGSGGGSSGGDSASRELMKHSFVLAPLSFDAKLRQADSNVCIDYPKYTLEGQMRALQVLLSKSQLELAKSIGAQIRDPSSSVARPLFPEYRPLVRVSDAPRDWWLYAFRCIGRLNGQRMWVEFYRAFQKRNTYVPLYKRYAHAVDKGTSADQKKKAYPWIVPLSLEERMQMDEIEHDRSISIEGIMTWRNIADAQFEKELEKHLEATNKKAASTKTSLFTSLFGSPTAEQKAGSGDAEGEEEPPVSLTVEELKQLETITMDQIGDSELSKDSRLADVKFTLGSLNVNLSSYGHRPLARLEMGTVSSSLDANADGSFSYMFSLSSLCVEDKVMPNSFFPSVLKNQDRPGVEDAFHVHLAKTKTGDLHVVLRLNTFETVASPLLLTELKRFAATSASAQKPRGKMTLKNPVLAQSISGSVDLFYDASQGSFQAASQGNIPGQISVTEGPITDADAFHQTSAGHSDLSNALIEAWKSKTETKTAWFIDVDLNAPIIVIPENCVSPRANVLVLDLGQLRLMYGNREPYPSVKNWFHANKHSNVDSTSEPVIDSGSISFSNLTFVVGKANYWRRLVRKYEEDDDLSDDEAIKPISLSMDFGIETTSAEGVPRVCVFGVIPLIALNISLSQMRRILSVSNAWVKVWGDLTRDQEELIVTDKHSSHGDNVSMASSQREKLKSLIDDVRRGSVFLASNNPNIDNPSTLLFVQLRLERFAVTVTSEDESGIEAQLVNVVASFATMSDSSSLSKLSMGWFWLLDRLESDFPRRQRLVAHSNLPLSPDAFAENDKYDIIAEITRIGAFKDDYSGSSELADIEFKQSGENRFLMTDPLSSTEGVTEVDSILEAKFSSLYINWNPQAIKGFLRAFSTFLAVFEASTSSEVGSLILSSPDQLEARVTGGKSVENVLLKEEEKESLMLVKATMSSFEVSLNSVKDDLPLFLLAMSSTELSMLKSESRTELALVLDDIRISTPNMGRTDPQYRTILGLAPGREESLLTVKYCDGSGSTERLSIENVESDKYEAGAIIELSPMRLVYIQAQVLALVEFATEGILGALTAQAASSAAAAAAELAMSTEKMKLFRVMATGFELVLPQAAYQMNYLSLTTGKMLVDYTALPDPGGGRAFVELADVTISDAEKRSMLGQPVKMTVDVSMPSEDIGTKDDQAMRIRFEISEAPFVFSKSQYAQILFTLDENIGEADLCVRDHELEQSSLQDKNGVDDGTAKLLEGLTHAGVATVDSKRRILLDTKIKGMSLLLCDLDEDDPIILLQAVEARICLNMLSDVEKMTANVTMKDLVCTDKRLKALGREHLSLMYQAGDSTESAQRNQDVFSIKYASNQDNSSTLDIEIGSPRFVFIPDAVSDILSFVSVDRGAQATVSGARGGVLTSETRDAIEVESSPGNDEIETSVVQEVVRPMSTTNISVKTSRCSFIMVDLGSTLTLPPANFRSSMSASVSPLAETVVFEG